MKFRIYTDGSFYSGNNRAGGGIVIIKDSAELFTQHVTIRGATSSNSSELSTFAEAVETMSHTSKAGDDLHFRTDSMFVVNAWNSPKDNQKEFIESLKRKLTGRNVTVSWHKGHSGHPHNELADTLAKAGVLAGISLENIDREDFEETNLLIEEDTQ